MKKILHRILKKLYEIVIPLRNMSIVWQIIFFCGFLLLTSFAISVFMHWFSYLYLLDEQNEAFLYEFYKNEGNQKIENNIVLSFENWNTPIRNILFFKILFKELLKNDLITNDGTQSILNIVENFTDEYSKFMSNDKNTFYNINNTSNFNYDLVKIYYIYYSLFHRNFEFHNIPIDSGFITVFNITKNSYKNDIPLKGKDINETYYFQYPVSGGLYSNNIISKNFKPVDYNLDPVPFYLSPNISNKNWFFQIENEFLYKNEIESIFRVILISSSINEKKKEEKIIFFSLYKLIIKDKIIYLSTGLKIKKNDTNPMNYYFTLLNLYGESNDNNYKNDFLLGANNCYLPQVLNNSSNNSTNASLEVSNNSTNNSTILVSNNSTNFTTLLVPNNSTNNTLPVSYFSYDCSRTTLLSLQTYYGQIYENTIKNKNEIIMKIESANINDLSNPPDYNKSFEFDLFLFTFMKYINMFKFLEFSKNYNESMKTTCDKFKLNLFALKTNGTIGNYCDTHTSLTKTYLKDCYCLLYDECYSNENGNFNFNMCTFSPRNFNSSSTNVKLNLYRIMIKKYNLSWLNYSNILVFYLINDTNYTVNFSEYMLKAKYNVIYISIGYFVSISILFLFFVFLTLKKSKELKMKMDLLFEVYFVMIHKYGFKEKTKENEVDKHLIKLSAIIKRLQSDNKENRRVTKFVKHTSDQICLLPRTPDSISLDGTTRRLSLFEFKLPNSIMNHLYIKKIDFESLDELDDIINLVYNNIDIFLLELKMETTFRMWEPYLKSLKKKIDKNKKLIYLFQNNEKFIKKSFGKDFYSTLSIEKVNFSKLIIQEISSVSYYVEVPFSRNLMFKFCRYNENDNNLIFKNISCYKKDISRSDILRSEGNYIRTESNLESEFGSEIYVEKNNFYQKFDILIENICDNKIINFEDIILQKENLISSLNFYLDKIFYPWLNKINDY